MKVELRVLFGLWWLEKGQISVIKTLQGHLFSQIKYSSLFFLLWCRKIFWLMTVTVPLFCLTWMKKWKKRIRNEIKATFIEQKIIILLDDTTTWGVYRQFRSLSSWIINEKVNALTVSNGHFQLFFKMLRTFRESQIKEEQSLFRICWHEGQWTWKNSSIQRRETRRSEWGL